MRRSVFQEIFLDWLQICFLFPYICNLLDAFRCFYFRRRFQIKIASAVLANLDVVIVHERQHRAPRHLHMAASADLVADVAVPFCRAPSVGHSVRESVPGLWRAIPRCVGSGPAPPVCRIRALEVLEDFALVRSSVAEN